MTTPQHIVEFREKFPTKIAEVIDDFGSTVKSDLEQFLISQIEAAEERGRNQGIQEAQQDYFEAGKAKADELLEEIAAIFSKLDLDYWQHDAENKCLYKKAVNDIDGLLKSARKTQV